MTERFPVLGDHASTSRPRPSPRPRHEEPGPEPAPDGDVGAITEILAVTPPRVEEELRKADAPTGEPAAVPAPVLPRVSTPRAPDDALSTRETAALARKASRARKGRAPRRVAGRQTPRSS